jgi:rhodanese-related sulfurtransferase/DNA-binding transcriptional ArsR family regulator
MNDGRGDSTGAFLMEQFARIGKALSSPQRLKLVELLAQAERTVEQLAGVTGLSIANTSQHLQVLLRARLVSNRKDGLYVHYSLADAAVYALWRSMQLLGEARLAEVREFLAEEFDDGAEAEAVTPDVLQERIRAGDVTLIDVRPAEEYRQAHLPGAVSMPVDEIESRLAELPKDREVVAYCRGPYCLLGPNAVRRLREGGFNASRLSLSVPEWARDGHPTNTEVDDS